jgi:hypothetical protein
VSQNLTCNKEEFDTDLHCLASAHLLKKELRERGYEIDPAGLSTEGWGASFDGCVTKYSITVRRLLGLAQPTSIDFALTVPDAAFLLDNENSQYLALENGLQLTTFKQTGQLIALYTLSSHSLAHRPTFVKLPLGLAKATIKSKQGTRLWPDPETYQVRSAPPEYQESSQQLVREDGGRIVLPASTGFVYRLAKAPAYIFAPTGMTEAEFSALLVQGELETS